MDVPMIQENRCPVHHRPSSADTGSVVEGGTSIKAISPHPNSAPSDHFVSYLESSYQAILLVIEWQMRDDLGETALREDMSTIH